MASSVSTGISKTNRAIRRIWTLEEETVLVNGLKDLLLQGWKADNGFRGGYTTVLQKHMQQHFPCTDIKAEPHISSKIKVWKKYYGALVNMQGRSGFGWDDSSNTITVKDDDIWNGHLKLDPNAKGMRYKSWPFFKDWLEIFGRDRATGENAQGFADIVDEILRQPSSDPSPDPEVNSPERTERTSGQEIGGTNGDSGSGTHGECRSATRKHKTRKRKSYADVELQMVSLMEQFCSATNSGFHELAARVGAQQDAKKQRVVVCRTLDDMSFLSVKEKLAIGRRLCSNTADLDHFTNIPQEEKEVMVQMMLEGSL